MSRNELTEFLIIFLSKIENILFKRFRDLVLNNYDDKGIKNFNLNYHLKGFRDVYLYTYI